MSSQLHQAIELAQAGQKDEARALLQQVVQSDPNNETAWMWLASVAANPQDYEKAVREALRINPDNDQAQRMLNQVQAQYGSGSGDPA
ncbi:MAG: tetratricopeptide repeat protein, partial [Chloroflexi bacterium]|nr:tetratricopeptide repeat protein [Chloroflexota bacterium]